MQRWKKPHQAILIASMLFGGILIYGTACTHKDMVLPASYNGSGATDPTNYVTRGSDIVKFSTTAGSGVYTFDKVHSNVMWETRFLGTGAILSGRFNWFGFNTFNFDEANPANTTFTAWVQLNQVNTGEPARDGGCLMTAFNTNTTADIPVKGEPVNEFNRALIQSKSVTYNPTENIYDVVCDLTFMGVTKEVKAKLGYSGKGTYPGTTNLLRGFDLRFSLSITDFPLKADQDEVNDKIDITANANFKQ